ncbi:hypothetical protein EJB05_08855, partial [Eragrostis curvula]
MSAADKRPGTRTASTCTAAETERVTHSFKIVGNSLHKGFGVGNFVGSATFVAGGFEWRILYYPDGHSDENKDYVAAFLELRTKDTEAHHYDLQPTAAARTKLVKKSEDKAVNRRGTTGFSQSWTSTLQSSKVTSEADIVSKCISAS